MHRHRTDLFAVLFGVAFVIAGTCFLVRETTDTAVDPAWATGLGLMLLGTVALVGTLARATGRGRAEPALPESPESQESDG